jgi:hypothetical protein
MHTIGGARPHCQGVEIPQDGSIVARAFDEKTSRVPITENVATLALARDQGKGVARLRAYK